MDQLGIKLSTPLENAAVIRVMDAEYKKSLEELTNLTRTTMKQSQYDRIKVADFGREQTRQGGVMLGSSSIKMD